MADIQKILHSLQIDTAKFLKRVKELSPLIDAEVTRCGELALRVEQMVADGQVENEILPEVKKILQQTEINTEYAYARHQSADERLLEVSLHLNVLLTTLQTLAANESTFDHLLTRDKGTTE